MKKITSLLLTLILTLSFTIVAFATDLSFSDVPSSNWAYPTIMKATELGLFKGTSTVDANGVGTFSPDRTMSRAEFITVCLRAAKIASVETSGGHWYDGSWEAAVKYGLITEQDFGGLSGMEQGMSRQEMAYVLVNTLEYNGEKATNIISPGRIPDYTFVNSFYKPYVLSAYTLGLICGQDKIGTFNPSGTLTRAQGATVLIRLLEKDARQKIDTSAPKAETPASVQTWNEGERHELAKAGDVVIKKDGTKVVLEATVVGHEANGQDIIVLGVNQRVDFWTGTVVKNARTGEDIVLGIGSHVNGDYRKSDTSKLVKHGNEVHSENEWIMITKLDQYRKPTTNGGMEGQIANTFWQWNEGLYNPEIGLYGEGFWALRDAIN